MKFFKYLKEEREQLKDWENYIKKNKELQGAIKIMNKLNKSKYKAYLVGGAVRDTILGKKSKDYDIATNATVDILEKLFKTYDIGKSKDFGIVVIKQDGFSYEVAVFRQDGSYSDGRRPETVQVTGSFKEDVERRDFTINAMGINANGEIVDYFDGRRDIKNKVLKTVGDPYKRFGEDYLRMLRLARFSSKLGFEIEKETEKAAKKLSHNIVGLSPERIKDELLKSASQSGDKFADYIITLDRLKLLKYILPAVQNLKWFRENLQHHPETRGSGGTVFSHTIEALKKSNTKDPIKNMAILLHDIGKGVSLSHEEGLPRYLEHAKKSMDLVDEIADNLRMSNKEREALIFAVGNHMKFHKILDMKPSKIAKLVSDDNWDVLVAVGRADEYARGFMFKHSGEFEKIVDKAIKVKEKFGANKVNKQVKLIDGKDVMKLTGLKPGPKIGEIITKTTAWIMDNNIEDKKEIEDYIISMAGK